MCILAYLGTRRDFSTIILGPRYYPDIHLLISISHVNHVSNSIRTFGFKLKILFIFIFVGAAMLNPWVPKLQDRNTSSHLRRTCNKEKYEQDFHTYGPQCEKNTFLAICWSLNNRTGSILFPSSPLSHINLQIKQNTEAILQTPLFVPFGGGSGRAHSRIHGYQNFMAGGSV